MAVATPIPSCLGLGSYTSGSPAIVEAWFHGLQRGWRPHYTPTLGFHLIYRGKGPLKENAKASYEGSLPGVALDEGLVPALPRTRLEVSLPKGPIRTQKGRTLVCTLLGPAALVRNCATINIKWFEFAVKRRHNHVSPPILVLVATYLLLAIKNTTWVFCPPWPNMRA